MSSTCYILMGPPGCGKSTWCDDNIDLMGNPVIVSSDDIVDYFARERGTTYTEMFNLLDYEFDIVPLMVERLREAIAHQRNVVLDQTNRSPRHRARFRYLFPTEYEFVGVCFDFDPGEIHNRVQLRGERTGKIIPDDVLERHIAQFVPPDASEFDRIIRIQH